MGHADLRTAVHDAYLTGWALTGGPLTEHVKAGCDAAVALALETPDDPRILELALDLGHLEGTWREVYDRREDLTADHLAKIMVIWRKLVRKLKPRDLVARYKRTLIDATEARREGPRRWQETEARQAALGWLYEIMSDPRYDDLAQAVVTALAAAAAEGKTAALAVAADQASAAGFDWQLAYASMYSGLAYLEDLPGMGDSWVQRILGGAATDVGRILAAMATSGAPDSEIAAAVMDAIDGEDVRAVDLFVDYAVSQSMVQASIDLYTSEGLDLVNWLDAGDSRVCPRCEENAANGPYSPANYPDIPHPRCRCAPSPASPLPLSAFADFLVPV